MSIGGATNQLGNLFLQRHDGPNDPGGEVDESGYSYTLSVDTDGDGTLDGQMPISPDELRNLLEPMGMQLVGGSIVSVDGFEMNAANGQIANNFGGDPVVDAAPGERASLAQVGGSIAGLNGEGCLAWMAIAEMARTSDSERATARELRDALQKAKFEESRNAIDATAAKIEAEKGAAWVQFAAAMGAAAVSIGGGVYGLNQGNSAMAQGIVASSNVVTAAGTAIDKNYGYQAEADRQELKSKHHDIEAAQLDMYIDDAASNYQEAKQAHDKAIKLLEDYMQRRTDSSNALLRG